MVDKTLCPNKLCIYIANLAQLNKLQTQLSLVCH